MITFALTCPSELTALPGAHPVKTYRSISGAAYTRLYGSLPVDSSLRLSFYCSTKQAGDVWRNYRDTNSGADPIELKPELFKGYEDILDAFPPELSWYMNAEPEVRARFPGRVELSVEFQGRLRARA